MDFQAFNAGIVEEFRANGGRVGGAFEGAPMLLLTTGEERRRLFDRMAEAMPNFREYEGKTQREIPVVVLERRG